MVADESIKSTSKVIQKTRPGKRQTLDAPDDEGDERARNREEDSSFEPLKRPKALDRVVDVGEPMSRDPVHTQQLRSYRGVQGRETNHPIDVHRTDRRSSAVHDVASKDPARLTPRVKGPQRVTAVSGSM